MTRRVHPSLAIELYGQNGGPVQIQTTTLDLEFLSRIAELRCFAS
jgi:hypothetical protein